MREQPNNTAASVGNSRAGVLSHADAALCRTSGRAAVFFAPRATRNKPASRAKLQRAKRANGHGNRAPPPRTLLPWTCCLRQCLMPDPVVVIGGGLAGMAAAARLAKVGHQVELYERSEALGGTWAPYQLPSGVTVDDAPSIIGFPAPWRDLFRKSGRPLEAELARMGYALEPAQPATMIFADGTELTLPTDRGGQYAALADAYGRSVAERWRDLLNRLDQVWQTLRGLGLETELRSRRQLNKTAMRSLFGHRMTLADLAASIAHDHLGALIRSIAYRLGSVPEQTPAFAAVELSIQRTFGRWQVEALDTHSELDVGRSSVLVEALAGRLALRKVHVQLGCMVECIHLRNGHVDSSCDKRWRPSGLSSRGHLRPLADLQLLAPGHRSPADPTPAARPQRRPRLRPSPTMRHPRPSRGSGRRLPSPRTASRPSATSASWLTRRYRPLTISTRLFPAPLTERHGAASRAGCVGHL